METNLLVLCFLCGVAGGLSVVPFVLVVQSKLWRKDLSDKVYSRTEPI